MSRVLVTGASGFIGRHLVPALRAAGHEVIERDQGDGDVADDATWAAWPAAEVVVHLAGRLSVPESWNGATEFLRVNLLGTVAALGYCERHGAQLVSMSSYLYGNPAVLPITETSGLVAANPYALSKMLAEEACQFFAERRSVDVRIFRLFNVYGPGQTGDFIIPLIVHQVRSGREIRVKDLAPKRDYVYVADVVRAILLAVVRRGRYSVLNIGSGVSHSVDEVITIIQQSMGTALPVYSAAERRQDEIMDTVADVGKAETELGWTPEWTLTQGLKKTCEHAGPLLSRQHDGNTTRADGVDNV